MTLVEGRFTLIGDAQSLTAEQREQRAAAIARSIAHSSPMAFEADVPPTPTSCPYD